MMSTMLSFQDVTFGYPSSTRTNGQTALHRLSLDIYPGTVTAILGPNGAGKTTLLHLALGWLKPQSGRVSLAGRSLGDYSRRELGRWMSLVPQSEHIPFEFSILEYVLLGRAPYLKPLEMPGAEDCQVATQALAQVGLDGWEDRPITLLSGGERQLVLMARALAQQPHLLLLDEPTSHLDLSNKGRVLQIVRGLVAQGVTVIFTTHDPDAAATVADSVVLMREGETLEAGRAEEILASDKLSETYGVPVEVMEVHGRRVILLTQTLPQVCKTSTSPRRELGRTLS